MLACTSRAANSVNEVLGYFRQIVVDDVGDVLHVDSARGEVGRHQDAVAPLLKAGQRRGALRLRAITVNHRGLDALAIQGLFNSLRPPPCAREDEATATPLCKERCRWPLFSCTPARDAR